MTSRQRARNFTEREKLLLLEIAKDFIGIIDNKKTDASNLSLKNQAWQEIAAKFNAAGETGQRSEKQLHALYDNIKKKAKRNFADDKCERDKTDGGAFIPKVTEVDVKVLGLLQHHITSPTNPYDLSAGCYELKKEESESAGSIIMLPPESPSSSHQGMVKYLQEESSCSATEPNMELNFHEELILSEEEPSSNTSPLLTPRRQPGEKRIASSPLGLTATKNNLLAAKKVELIQKQIDIETKREQLVEAEHTLKLIEIEEAKLRLEEAKLRLEVMKKNLQQK